MSDSWARGSDRSRLLRHDAIDPGHELPLSVDGRPGRALDRHLISIQWLTATVLVGLCGAALMGGAVLASLDRKTATIARPEYVEQALRGALSGGDEAHRSDRLSIPRHQAFVRQPVRLSTIRHVGNREVVRTGSFVRVGGALSLTASSRIADLPPYNPQRLLAASAPGGKASPKAAARSNTAVSFVMRDLSRTIPKLKVKFVTPPAQVMARVRKAALWSRKSADPSTGAPDITGIKLAYADEDARDPFAGLEARIVPENITMQPKTHDTITGGTPFKEHVIVAKKGDSVAAILHGLGAPAGDITALLPLLGHYGGNHGLATGDKVDVLLNPLSDGKDRRPVRVIVADATGPQAVAALADSGKYVAVDPGSVDDEWAARDDGDEDDTKPASSDISLYQSVYATALRNHVPRPIIDDLVRIYAFDVDFDRHVQTNDAFHILYAGTLNHAATDDRKDILFASLTVDGRTKRLYRFQSPATGRFHYYDAHGRSARKFLLRKPVASGKLTSGFGWRRHPLLGYVAMHTGVDWGCPVGTPIYAAGNGVIEKEGWESGYGRYVRIRHAYGYETAYAHMSAYARGTHVGEHVKQGQVIGFVGSTGLATGPHLHFEIHINGRFVDPLRVKLPDGHRLKGPELAAFERERKRIDKIMARAPLQVAARQASAD